MTFSGGPATDRQDKPNGTDGSAMGTAGWSLSNQKTQKMTYSSDLRLSSSFACEEADNKWVAYTSDKVVTNGLAKYQEDTLTEEELGDQEGHILSTRDERDSSRIAGILPMGTQRTQGMNASSTDVDSQPSICDEIEV